MIVFSIAFLTGCVHVNQFLLSFYSLNARLFIAETFNHNKQHYSSKTKSPLNMSGSHQPTSTSFQFQQWYQNISYFSLIIQYETLYTFFLYCVWYQSLKFVFQKRGRCIVCGMHFSVIKPVIQFWMNQQSNENFQGESQKLTRSWGP